MWNNVELVEMVELYAISERCIHPSIITCEKELSDRFDAEHADWLHDHRDDQAMIDEQFNNWTDGLCKDGEIHPEQYYKYTYVGKYSE